MPSASAALALLAVALLLFVRLQALLHILQQEHYENARLRLWVSRHPSSLGLPVALVSFAGGVAVSVAQSFDSRAGAAVAAAACLAAAVYARAAWRKPRIKPLVYTSRARRLLGVGLVFAVSPSVPAALLGDSAVLVGLAGAAGYLASPWLLCAANTAVMPVQRLEARRYAGAARKVLAEVGPCVVGITGSYGKTTTKGCVAAVLDVCGPTLPTPASFNTYLGVVRAINEGLRPEHRFFVAEMGAYRAGDVAELCDLVGPRIGVLTAIGPAHLERFGSLDVTEQAKGELAASLPADGLFVTRADDERCRRVAAERATSRVILFSPEPHADADVWAEGVEIRNGRTDFRLRSRGDDPADVPVVRSRLLGRHNVANLLAAAAVGLEAGATSHQVARTLGRVQPPEHRLSPIVNASAGIVVIDDSYNANPVGAAAALDVLRAHPAARRILVTPGMVELGEDERALNREFGVLAASACDLCVLSGSRATDVRDGLLAAGFPEQHIVMTVDGPAAHAQIAQLSRTGDVILFENDLPDVYA